MNRTAPSPNLLLPDLEPRNKEAQDTLFENKKEWLDSAEAATYLSLSVGSLRNMTSNGNIPHYKLGRRNRYRLEDLRNLLLSQKRGSNGN
jgi:excisionase family DNA binding protein